VIEQSSREITNNQSISTESIDSLPLFIKKLLCKFARYYNGKMFRFVLNNSTLNLAPDENSENKPLLLIVSRAFYTEQAKSFPIDNKAELNKLLALQYPTENNYHTHSWGSENGQSQVNIWQFDQQLPAASLCLPETLLLALSAQEQQVLSLVKETNDNENNKPTLFIGRLGKVIHSLVPTVVINSAQRFIMSIGIPPTDDNVEISADSLPTQLGNGIKKLSLPLISNFIQRGQKADNLQRLKNITAPLLLVLSIYLALSSGYLLFKKFNLQQQLDQNSSEVSQALDIQQLLDKNQTRYLALNDFLASQQNRSPLWLIMVDIFPEAQFTNIRFENERYVLRGSAKQATDVLELFNDNARVLEAKFDFPTRKSRNRDNFVISFKLMQPLAITTQSKAKDNND